MKFDLRFTQEEMEGLVQLLDAALKSGGINVLKQTNYFVNKLENATPVKEEEKENGS